MTLRKEQMEGIEMTNGNTIKSEEKDKVVGHCIKVYLFLFLASTY